MAKRLDDEKRLLWVQRLARFQSSGLTVVRFCEQERLSVASFHYWARRIRASNAGRTEPVGRVKVTNRRAPAGQLTETESSPRKAAGKNCASKIHFRVGRNARVSIPAECLDALRCVMEYLTADGGKQDAFRSVLLKSR